MNRSSMIRKGISIIIAILFSFNTISFSQTIPINISKTNLVPGLVSGGVPLDKGALDRQLELKVEWKLLHVANFYRYEVDFAKEDETVENLATFLNHYWQTRVADDKVFDLVAIIVKNRNRRKGDPVIIDIFDEGTGEVLKTISIQVVPKKEDADEVIMVEVSSDQDLAPS